MPFSSAFDEITRMTDNLPNASSLRFINLDNVFWCSQLRLFTFEQHEYPSQCCDPVLVRCLFDYAPSGWFPNDAVGPHPHIYAYLNGEWMKYEED